MSFRNSQGWVSAQGQSIAIFNCTEVRDHCSVWYIQTFKRYCNSPQRFFENSSLNNASLSDKISFKLLLYFDLDILI